MSRYKKHGWFGESHRHYLAAKGIATKRFFASRLPTVPIGAFGPSKTAFGRMAENVGVLTDVRHKKMVQRRDKLAGEVDDFTLRREALAKSAADAPSLEGLSNVRRLVDKDTGVPLKDDATEEERANAVREKLSQFEQAMMSGLRPEQEVRKKEILSDLGVGTSKVANALSAFPRYSLEPGSTSDLTHQSVEQYQLDLAGQIELEEKLQNDPATTDATRESSGKLVGYYTNEQKQATDYMKTLNRIDNKMRKSEKLSRAEQSFLGRAVLNIDEGKSHRAEDVKERERGRGLPITEFEQSQGRPAIIDTVSLVSQPQPVAAVSSVSKAVERKVVVNPKAQFVKPVVKKEITELTPLDAIPDIPKQEKHDFEA
jgi:hypothetical protein